MVILLTSKVRGGLKTGDRVELYWRIGTNNSVGRVHGYKRIHFKTTEAAKGLGWCHFLVVLLFSVAVCFRHVWLAELEIWSDQIMANRFKDDPMGLSYSTGFCVFSSFG